MKYYLQALIGVLIFGLVLTTLPALVYAQGSLERRSGGTQSTEVERDRDDSDDKYDNSDVRRLVEREFGSNHVMVDVARCESSYRQYISNGDVLVNSIGATGVFQILQRVHEEIAEDFGYDIYTLEGNIGYARALYEADGLKPWSASSLCWDDGTIAEANPEQVRMSDNTSSGKLLRRVEQRRQELNLDGDQIDTDRYPEVISRRLIIGVENQEVLKLQQLLNQIGYRLSSNGPGSPGEETDFFGTLTKQALQKFQCDQSIVCTGSEYTTGFGMTEERTRAALNKVAATGITSGRVRQRDEIPSPRSHESAGSVTQDELQEQIRLLTEQVAALQAQLAQ